MNHLVCSIVLSILCVFALGCSSTSAEKKKTETVVLDSETIAKMSPGELEAFLKEHQLKDAEKSRIQEVDFSKRHSVEKRERLGNMEQQIDHSESVFPWRGKDDTRKSERLRDKGVFSW